MSFPIKLKRHCLALLFLLLLSCKGEQSVENNIAGLTPEDAADFIDPGQLLAYTTKEEQAIYVAAGQEQLVAEALGAKVEGRLWHLQEDNGAAREKKELKPEDYYPRVAIIKWTYLNGFKCTEKEAGSWINITTKRGKFVRSYQTTEPGWWCMREPGRCKIIFKEVTGDFWTRPEGRGERKTETRKLSACVQ